MNKEDIRRAFLEIPDKCKAVTFHGAILAEQEPICYLKDAYYYRWIVKDIDKAVECFKKGYAMLAEAGNDKDLFYYASWMDSDDVMSERLPDCPIPYPERNLFDAP